MKKLIMSLITVMLLSITGCTNEKPQEEVKEPEEIVVQEDKKVEDDVTEQEPVEVILYVPDEDYMKMETKTVSLDFVDAQNIVNELIKEKVLPEGCKVNSININDTNLEVDLNSAFGEHIRGMGTTGEYFMLGCTVNTFLDVYDKEAVNITVDGEVLESGHSVYEGYLTRFNTEP